MNEYKVLIVDDESIIREGLRKHVNWEGLGFQVSATAESAQAALACAESCPPDILITDICMRGRDGLSLVEDLLERNITPQVILISSYNDFSYAQRAVRLAVVREYLLKPVDLDHLSQLLQDLKKELDQKRNELTIPLSAYRQFLQEIRRTGYDRYEITHHIKSGETSQAEHMWKQAETVMLSPITSLPMLRRFCLSFLVSLISDGVLKEEDTGEQDPVKGLECCESREEITAYIGRLIHEESEAVCRKSCGVRSKLIETALQIIEKEYCNPDFNLTVLAASLNVTPNYLSSRFKDELGVGFMKYRLEKQMERAMLLLANPANKIYLISSMVGFLDEKYFSRQFKKYTGDSPKDYRNKRTS